MSEKEACDLDPDRTRRRESDELRSMLDALSAIVYAKDANNVIVRASRAAAAAFGLAPADLEGRSCAELFPRDAARLHHDDLEVIRTRRPKRDVFERLALTGGRKLWVRSDKLPLLDAEGSITGVLVVCEDITQEKTLEDTLATEGPGYRADVEEPPFGYFRTDAHGTLTVVSDGVCEFTGRGREDLLGSSWATAVHPDDAPRLAARIRRATDARALSDDVEYRAQRADGSYRILHVRVVADANETGDIRGFVGTCSDVTGRRLAEEELRRSERRFETLAAIAPVGIYRGDIEGRSRFVNDRWCELSGLTHAESRGYGWRRAIHPEDYARFFDGLRVAAEGHRPYSCELRLLHPDGRIVWVINHCVAETDAAGIVVGYLGVVTDITDLKEAAEENQLLRDQLEERVRQRTAALETANKELEAFCYSVSHDLRAPLRTIDGFSMTLLEEHGASLDPDAHGLLDRVREASQRMGHLIDELLTLSRLTRWQLNYGRVDLSAMARSLAADLARVEPQRKVRFVVADGLEIGGDAELLRSVLQNLLGNAWKFTGRRAEAHIEFGCDGEAGAGERIYFVRDDGVGFDMAHSSKLFRAFERLHHESFEGSGIGLATVERIVKRHGGRVWAVGAPDKGATFFFTLRETPVG